MSLAALFGPPPGVEKEENMHESAETSLNSTEEGKEQRSKRKTLDENQNEKKQQQQQQHHHHHSSKKRALETPTTTSSSSITGGAAAAQNGFRELNEEELFGPAAEYDGDNSAKDVMTDDGADSSLYAKESHQNILSETTTTAAFGGEDEEKNDTSRVLNRAQRPQMQQRSSATPATTTTTATPSAEQAMFAEMGIALQSHAKIEQQIEEEVDREFAVMLEAEKKLQEQRKKAEEEAQAAIAAAAAEKKGQKKKTSSGEKDKSASTEEGQQHPMAILQNGMEETERDRLIRLGVLTPFDSMDGLERRREKMPAAGAAAANVPKTAFSGTAFSSRPLSAIAKHKPPISPTTSAGGGKKMSEKIADHVSAARKERSAGKSSRLPPKHPLRVDDSDELSYQARMVAEDQKGKKGESAALRRAKEAAARLGEVEDELDMDHFGQVIDEAEEQIEKEGESDDEEEEEEPVVEDVTFAGGLQIPGNLYNRLLPYQRTGVQWLWELHCQGRGVGGIVGDEMGLGKTIQTIAFLAALNHSDKFKPSIIVCPATILGQWVQEFHVWYPPMRVFMLHNSGSHTGGPSKLIRKAHSASGVIITTYEQIRINSSILTNYEWQYVILDEGHRIRNPDADITLKCKSLKTEHRLILSGSPIQNRLAELWSLFDFVFPGRLGTLPVFKDSFAVPIALGGFANATSSQVEVGVKCAMVLRDIIKPYFMRRVKADVGIDIPPKTEQVLFCRLSTEQRKAYQTFLNSNDVRMAAKGEHLLFAAIMKLRKICNHVDLLDLEFRSDIDDYGNVERSGKMQVLQKIMRVWKNGGHRVLLFAQTRQMLDILELFLQQENYIYRRMDGNTNIASRLPAIDQFNSDRSIFCFLLTTKVGGIGVNLTGADRVVLFEPDWNPTVDVQARERACRIGQTKEVAVYRLLTTGTIEEKIYHRQIFKQLLSNRILSHPRQQRMFLARDLKDLFVLAPEDADGTGTGALFAECTEEIVAKDVDPESDEEEEDVNGKKKSGETKILRKLLQTSGVHSAIDHDKVLAGATTPDISHIRREAERVASKAAAALKRSSLERAQQPQHLPTWTGSRGSAGGPAAPTPPPRFGQLNFKMLAIAARDAAHAASSAILKKLPNGNDGNGAGGATGSIAQIGVGGSAGFIGLPPTPIVVAAPPVATAAPSNGAANGGAAAAEEGIAMTSSALLDQMRRNGVQGAKSENDDDKKQQWAFETMKELREILSRHRGGITTEDLIESFQGKLKDQSENIAWKSMLWELAKFTPAKRGQGKWSLKFEYL